MQDRYFPIEETLFKTEIEPVILAAMTWKGRPPKVTHYNAFCGILYVLRTGIPWRDMIRTITAKRCSATITCRLYLGEKIERYQ